MKYGLEPVLFPGKDFHVLFRLAVAGQDPMPIVGRFLRRALKMGLLDRTEVVSRVLSPLGYVPVLADGRWHAYVYVEFGGKTYSTHYTMFPSLGNLRAWYRLAREMGDARLLGAGGDADADGDADGIARIIPENPQAIRWCPFCEGLNPRFLLRCLWCRQRLAPPGAETPALAGGSPPEPLP